MYLYLYVIIISLFLNYCASLELKDNLLQVNTCVFIIPIKPNISKKIIIEFLYPITIFKEKQTTESQTFNNGLSGKVSPRRGQRYRWLCIN